MGLIELGQVRMRWGSHKGNNNNYIETPNHAMGNYYSPSDKEIYPTQNMSLVDIYKTTAEVFIVFNRFASMFSNGVWKLEDLKGKEIENHEILDLLKKPNPLYSGVDLDVYSALSYWITGNVFIYKSYDIGQKIPTLLHLLPTENMKLIMANKGIYEQTKIEDIIQRYELFYSESSKYNKTFNTKDIAHFKNNDITNALVGESVIEALHMPISNIRGAYGYRNVNIVKRGALGVLYNETGKDSFGNNTPGSASDRQRVDRQYTEETHGIFKDQATISMLNGKWGFVSTSGDIKNMMLFEEVSEDMKKIIDAVGLNDNIFSKEKSKIQANLSDGLKMAYQDGIIPFADKFANHLTNSLNLKGMRLKKDYSHLEVLQENQKEKSEIAERNVKAISTLISTGKYTKEEAELIVLGAKQ